MDKLDTSDQKLKKKSCDSLAQPNGLFNGRHAKADVSLMDRSKPPASERHTSGPRNAKPPEPRGIQAYWKNKEARPMASGIADNNQKQSNFISILKVTQTKKDGASNETK